MDDQDVRIKMQKALDHVVEDVASIRTGRATPSMVEDIVVPAYGGTQHLKVVELATISASDERTIVIDPWDKSIMGDIRKGILEAKAGLNPIISENILRISLPPLTAEDRERYVKLLGQKIESGKVMVRQIRGDALKDIRQSFEDKVLTEDEKFDAEKQLQQITDEFTQDVEEVGEKKEKEIRSI